MQLKKIPFSPLWLKHAIGVGIGDGVREDSNKSQLGSHLGEPQMQDQGVRVDLLGNCQKPRAGMELGSSISVPSKM